VVAADVPLWFAGVALLVPALTGLGTLLITNRNTAEAFKREAADRKVARDYETRSDTWRALRADRIELYRRLVAAARKLLDVDKPMMEQHEQNMQGGYQSLLDPKPGRFLGIELEDLDTWQALFIEAELIGPNVVPAARAVRERYDELFGFEVQAQADDGTIPVKDATLIDDGKSRELVGALVGACAADIASMTEPG
jgi:hypothetical protein